MSDSIGETTQAKSVEKNDDQKHDGKKTRSSDSGDCGCAEGECLCYQCDCGCEELIDDCPNNEWQCPCGCTEFIDFCPNESYIMRRKKWELMKKAKACRKKKVGSPTKKAKMRLIEHPSVPGASANDNTRQPLSVDDLKALQSVADKPKGHASTPAQVTAIRKLAYDSTARQQWVATHRESAPSNEPLPESGFLRFVLGLSANVAVTPELSEAYRRLPRIPFIMRCLDNVYNPK